MIKGPQNPEEEKIFAEEHARVNAEYLAHNIALARIPRLAEYGRVCLPFSREPTNGFPCSRAIPEPIGGTPIGMGDGMMAPARTR